jgi:hypothetical protein
MYPTLKEWAAELKVFYHKQLYPGSWEGIDVHGDKRELLKMPLEDLPFAVRAWYACFFVFLMCVRRDEMSAGSRLKWRKFADIDDRLKKTPKQRHFSVQDDVVFFAPGAIYPILPLWVDEADDKNCDGRLS